MAAITAIRHCPRFNRTYAQMLKAGKAPKLAIVAIARKLIVIINAVLRDQIPFKA